MESMYDTVMGLAKKNQLKKLMISLNGWDADKWCIVSKIIFQSDGKEGIAFGHINDPDGTPFNGKIERALSPQWSVIKVLEDDLETEFIN